MEIEALDEESLAKAVSVFIQRFSPSTVFATERSWIGAADGTWSVWVDSSTASGDDVGDDPEVG